MNTPAVETEDFDTLIVGAGLSGIGSAVHLRQRCPDQTFAILEGRARLGGTWDLFRYPGVRSDSDMHTLGYAFKPWTGAQALPTARPSCNTSKTQPLSTGFCPTSAWATG